MSHLTTFKETANEFGKGSEPERGLEAILRELQTLGLKADPYSKIEEALNFRDPEKFSAHKVCF